MSFTSAFIKDSLRKIIDELNRQAKVIDQVIKQNEELKVLFKEIKSKEKK